MYCTGGVSARGLSARGCLGVLPLVPGGLPLVCQHVLHRGGVCPGVVCPGVPRGSASGPGGSASGLPLPLPLRPVKS